MFFDYAFHLPDYASRYAGAATATADLIPRGAHWYLHIVVAVPAPQIAASAAVIGVDLGLAQPAVTSNNRFLGKRIYRELEARIFRVRRKL